MSSELLQAIERASPLDVDCPSCGTEEGGSCYSNPLRAYYCIDRTKEAVKQELQEDGSAEAPDFSCVGPGILSQRGWYVPEEGDLITVRNMTVDEEADGVGFEQGKERAIRVTSVERVGKHRHRIEGSYVEDS